MDYLNNDCAPDLMRFMKTSMNNGNGSYYNFLSKIGEKSLPIFTKEQIDFADSISGLLPIVRGDEYLILKQMLNEGNYKKEDILSYNSKVNNDSFNNALIHLNSLGLIKDNKLKVIMTEKLSDFICDILDYGLNRYEIEFGEFDGLFKLYGNYYSEQIQTVKLRSFSPYMRGTEFDTKNHETYCYVTLNKDVEKSERLNYKDKFLSPSIFQWESVKDTTPTKGDGPKLLATRTVHLFIRKMKKEDGIIMPFTYFGTGKFINQRLSYTTEIVDGVKEQYPTLMFDIKLDNKVPEEYWFDFEIPEEGEN